MSLKNKVRIPVVALLSFALAGCGQALISAYADAQADSETPESVGEVASKYRGQSCSELALAREHAVSETTRIGRHTEYSQKHGRWKLAAVEQAEREKGCVLGISFVEANTLEYIAKNPGSAKELDSKLKSPAARKALAALISTSQPPKSKPDSTTVVQKQAVKPKRADPVSGKAKGVKPATTEELSAVSPASTSTSQSSRGWLGAVVQETPIAPVLAASLGLSPARGVFVQGVVGDSAADRAGMRSMDVIFSADDREFNNSDSLMSYLASLSPAHKLKLKVWRNRSTESLTVNLSDTKPDAMGAMNSAGFCYVLAIPPMEGMNNLVWVSDIFPVADQQSQLQLRGQAAGDAFKNFLQQEKVPQASGLKGFGICSPHLNSLTTLWNAELASHRSPAFKATGSEGVVLYWRP